MSCKCQKAIVLLGKPNSSKTTTLREAEREIRSARDAIVDKILVNVLESL